MKTEIFANVWDAIEDSPAKAEEMTRRSDLMILLESYITRNELTNSQAAAVFGVAENCIAELMRGDINSFKMSSLISMAAAASLPWEATTK